jgi:hypothetical protein
MAGVMGQAKAPAPQPLVDGLGVRRWLVVEPEFAVAAVAASAAALAQMVGAGVLSAMCTDSRGFRFADAADKSCWCHLGVPVVFLCAGGRATG